MTIRNGDGQPRVAATVRPGRRARRREARRAKYVARQLAAAGIKADDARLGGGTALTEPVALLEGSHRSTYVLSDREDRTIGHVVPAEGCPQGYRSRYELVAPDGARILAMHIARRRGTQPDAILSADDTELLRLERTDPGGQRYGRSDVLAALGTPPRRLHKIRPNALGFGARWLVDGGRPVGQLRPPAGRRPARRRVLTDAGGAEVARVTRVLGGAGPSGTDHAFVIDVRDGADDRFRAAALFTGVLWDWNIISWDAGG